MEGDGVFVVDEFVKLLFCVLWFFGFFIMINFDRFDLFLCVVVEEFVLVRSMMMVVVEEWYSDVVKLRDEFR